MRQSLKTADDTEALGARLAEARPAALDQPAIVHLTGELGAGKTTLAKGFARACGIAAPVRSPTYTLMNVHEADALTLVHLDLYRLRDPAELEHLGLREWARAGCLWLIEWPERAAGLLPAPDLTVRLTAGPDAHEAEISAGTVTGAHWLERALPARAPSS
ncbi:MAG TPA: tRNA (adenosine(37)-N6)-threonylcarbamoyltransferase complex ATPase subunit type 1 TsaE [Steroidobacteraceae bacterium]|nr:tRNA (adenosine(37)-N6)-threonylcarbamoyltransferase complex ATPase subunit type 1 TsaE [Steroidobacteraceae bacterium]